MTAELPFGTFLRHLRKRAGMTQRDLAAALSYSDSLISSLEKGQRKPDLEAVSTKFIPGLGLQDDPATAARLVERAAAARGERPPVFTLESVSLERSADVVVQNGLYEPLQLAPAPTELIGRSDQISQLGNRLLGHSGRLLTLLGPPGIGKTCLATAVATSLQPFYSDSVVFVPLADVYDTELMASTILAAAAGRDVGPRPPRSQLIAFLRRKSMLLVLDNCEQIREATSLVADLLTGCTRLVILATSRERLHLRAEQRYRVPPLEPASAVELFARCAAAVDADFVLTEAIRPTVELICQQLDRLPLAIELCAAQVDILPLDQLLARLQRQRLDLLVDGAYDLPPRQRALRHAIRHSYTLLSEQESTVFCCLGVFAGGFALSELVGTFSRYRLDDTQDSEPSELLPTLHALVGKSLVHTETLPTGEKRFVLLETIREFALEQLRAQDAEAELRKHHYATYLELFRSADSHLRGPEYVIWLARLKPEQDNLRAAMRWALDTARYRDAAWLMLAAGYFWAFIGNGYEQARWLEQVLAYRHVLPNELRIAVLLTFYRAAFALEEFQPVAPYMDEITELLTGSPYTLLQATAWSFRAWIAADTAAATADLQRAIAATDKVDSLPVLGKEFGALADRDFVLATMLWGFAALLLDQGQKEQAARYTAESLQYFRKSGNYTGIGECMGILGRLALLEGEIAQAHGYFREAATTATTLNYSPMQREWQSLLAITTLYQGDAVEARRLLHDSLRCSLEQKNAIVLAQICAYLAAVALWEGELDESEQWLARSFVYQVDLRRIELFQVERLFIAARLATAKQDYRRAATLFGAADQQHSHVHFAYAGKLRTEVNAGLATVQTMLDPQVFGNAYNLGQQLSCGKELVTLVSPATAAGMRVSHCLMNLNL